MIICICHRVSDRDIARATHQGCASFDELQFELSVATSCGRCHDCARETFHHHAAQREQEVHVVASGADASRCPAARRVVVIHAEAAGVAGV
jgi:bacterioferritin-associated ferredoxin